MGSGLARCARAPECQPGSEPFVSGSERNLVVHVVAPAGARSGQGRLPCSRRSRRAEIGARAWVLRAEVAAASPAGPIQYGQLRVEALQHDLGRIAVLTGLILP